MNLEVCIVAYESEDSLQRAVRSITVMGNNVTVAIHDNSEVALQLDSVRRLADESRMVIRVEHCEDNCGFARGCNSLARSSTADVLLFLNPDAEILTWPDSMCASIKGIVGPIVVDNRGRVMPTYGRRRSILEEFVQRWARRRPRIPRGEGYVSGASLLVPRETFVALGGFDERFFMYYEDIDLCLRANQADISVTVEPSWRVRHEGGHAASRDRGTALIQSYDSACYFYAKHGMNVALYRTLCHVDALIRLALFSIMPSRRNAVRGVRRLLTHLHAASDTTLGLSRRPSRGA